MKNLYSRLVLIFSILVITGYLIVSAAWVPMNNNATTGTQFTATIWNNLVGNMNDLDTRVSSIISSLWSTGATNSINYTAGNVGIGTVVPNKLLHLKTTTGTNAELDIQSGTKPFWGIYHDETSEELRFWNGANRMVFASGGNVGIGTVSPVNKFEVDGGASVTIARISSTNTSGSAAGLIISNSTKTAWNDGLQIIHGGGTTKFNDLTGTNIMSLDVSNARVGIGTQSPSYLLHLEKVDTTNPLLYVKNNGGSGISPTAVFRGGANNTSAHFQVQDYNGNPNFVVRGDGNVGIGTASPSAKLHVESTAAGVIKYTNGGTSIIDIGNANGLFGIGTTSDAAFYATANLYFMSNGGSTKLAMVNGNVGIGTTGPGAKMHIKQSVDNANGAIRIEHLGDTNSWEIWNNSSAYLNFSYNTSVGFTLLNNGNATLAWTLTQNSDIRLKKDITPIENSLEKIFKLNGVNYYWKDSTRDTRRQIGVIAQEVEEVLPELVSTDGKGIKSVNYAGLVAPLIEAVKELKKENNSLKSLVCLDHPSAEICQ